MSTLHVLSIDFDVFPQVSFRTGHTCQSARIARTNCGLTGENKNLHLERRKPKCLEIYSKNSQIKAIHW